MSVRVSLCARAFVCVRVRACVRACVRGAFWVRACVRACVGPFGCVRACACHTQVQARFGVVASHQLLQRHAAGRPPPASACLCARACAVGRCLVGTASQYTGFFAKPQTCAPAHTAGPCIPRGCGMRLSVSEPPCHRAFVSLCDMCVSVPLSLRAWFWGAPFCLCASVLRCLCFRVSVSHRDVCVSVSLCDVCLCVSVSLSLCLCEVSLCFCASLSLSL